MDRTDLALKMSKLVHEKCGDAPHDIGLQLLYLIEEYESALRQPPVSGRSELLIDFLKWLNTFEEMQYTEKGIQFYVSEYLKSINSH